MLRQNTPLAVECSALVLARTTAEIFQTKEGSFRVTRLRMAQTVAHSQFSGWVPVPQREGGGGQLSGQHILGRNGLGGDRHSCYTAITHQLQSCLRRKISSGANLKVEKENELTNAGKVINVSRFHTLKRIIMLVFLF